MNLIALTALTDNSLRRLAAGTSAPRVAARDAATPPSASDAQGLPQAGILGARVATLLAALSLAACASLGPAGVDATAPPAPTVAAAPVEAALPVAPALPASAAAGNEPTALAAPAVVAPVDPLRPEVHIDLEDRSARTDLWQRVRNGFGIADLDDEFVRRRERYYAGQPEYVQRMTQRGTRYLFHIVEEVQRRNLPSELALLPFIESAFNPQAMSRSRASGMWQFMPGTGRDFELTQNVFRDDRRDVLASTRAALDYLTRLRGMFGDWHLALAAYNWGEGNVQRAIRTNQRAGKPTDYASLKMPAETRDYVPKLQAVKNIVADPAAFALTLPALYNHPYFLSVPISRDIDVALATRLAKLPLAEFQELNPQLNKPVILAAGTPQVLLPYDNANAFVAAIAAHPGPLATWTAWVAPRTMQTAQVAAQVGMTESELRTVNDIPPRMLVKAGSTLLVPRSEQRRSDVPEQIAENATMSLTPDGPVTRRVVFLAGKRGDTVGAVARRYRVSAVQVAQWNKVATSARFAAGTQVVVFVPKRGAKPAPVRAASKKSGSAKVAAVKRSGKRGSKVVNVATAPAASRTR